jgi:putative FmdB family regulatory protein
VQLFERAQAAPALVQLVLGGVDGAVALHRLLAQVLHLGLEAGALVRADALALGQLGGVAGQLGTAPVVVLALEAEASDLVLELDPARGHLGEPALEAREGGLGAGDVGLCARVAAAQIVGFLLGGALAVAQLFQALVLLDGALGLGGLFLLDREELFFQLGLLAPQVADAPLQVALLGGGGGAPLFQVPQLVARPGDLGLVGAHLVVGEEGRVLGLLGALLGGQGGLAHDLELGLARGEGGPGALFTLGLLGAAALLDLVQGDDLEELVGGLVEDEVFELVAVRDVALGLGGLALEGREAPLDLGDDVPDAQEVLARLVHLELGLLLPGLVLGDAGGLLDEEAAVLGAGGDDEPDLALLDDGVRLGADAGAEEEVGDVLEADLGLVDQVLARAVAEEAPGDGDLGVVAVLEGEGGGDLGVAVVEREGDLGHAVGAAVLRAVEDDVGHGAAAQVLGALLAHGPPDGVDDVRLAAAVRPHDADDVRVEMDDRPVDERLETADFELPDAHELVATAGGAEPTPSGGACVQCHPYRSAPRERCRVAVLTGDCQDHTCPRSGLRGVSPMPTYEYACSSCRHEWEAEQSIKDAALTECPSCHAATAKRQISRGGGFILKGGGWYADLYSSSSNKPADKPAETASPAGASTSAPAAGTSSEGSGSSGSGSSGSGSGSSGSGSGTSGSSGSSSSGSSGGGSSGSSGSSSGSSGSSAKGSAQAA